ncbi:MAG: 3'-5' exonuclease, partial [Candidatus Omnitrophica bacterium]|nr:3'-5' exonuclease [Candidatus Omnitrophota bacterium]
SPIDDLSFVSFILGDIFSKATGLSNEILRNFVFEVHRGKKNKDGPFYRLFKSNFPDIWEDYLSIFFKKVGFVSVYELITAIYQKYNLLNDFHGYQAFFMKFLELIKSQENDFLGLDEFLAYLEKAPLEDLYVKVTSHNAVRVLTIHKSKGLEFGVVIIPFFRIDISADTGAKGTKSHVVDDQSRLLGLIRITKDYCGYSQNLNAIYLRDYKKACIDELNSLYVALTRAKDELYIYIPKRSAASKNKAAFLIPDSYKEFGEKKTFPSKSQPGSSSIITINEQAYSDWLSFLRLEFDSRFYLSERKNLLKGNIYHLFLSYIGNCYGKPLDSLINSAREFVQAKYPFSEEIADCERVVKTMLAADWLKEVFFVSQGTVYCEKEVANKFGEIKRIDRLIVGDASVKIIDYKSSKENPVEQTAQMVEYIRIVNQIYPDHDVCGQLLYLDSLKLETVRG